MVLSVLQTRFRAAALLPVPKRCLAIHCMRPTACIAPGVESVVEECGAGRRLTATWVFSWVRLSPKNKESASELSFITAIMVLGSCSCSCSVFCCELARPAARVGFSARGFDRRIAHSFELIHKGRRQE